MNPVIVSLFLASLGYLSFLWFKPLFRCLLRSAADGTNQHLSRLSDVSCGSRASLRLAHRPRTVHSLIAAYRGTSAERFRDRVESVRVRRRRRSSKRASSVHQRYSVRAVQNQTYNELTPFARVPEPTYRCPGFGSRGFTFCPQEIRGAYGTANARFPTNQQDLLTRRALQAHSAACSS
jgi:hypothetical protein